MMRHAWSQLPETRSKADVIYENLREAIVGGGFRPGERVNMDEVAREFGVSKIPVREAVKRLESDGLVVARVHAGVVVAQVDVQEMRGVFLAREAIEGLVARLAAEAGDEALVAELERVQAAMREELSRGETAGLAELNSQFHQAMATATGYRILGELTEQLLSTIRRYRVTAPQDETSWRSVVEEHDVIIDALRGGDPETVEAAARAHTVSQAGHEIERP
jgi:DNA-binding GntR family transcriptional regulator